MNCPVCGKPTPHQTGKPATADVLGPLLAFSPYTCDDLRSHDKWDPRLVELRREAMIALRTAGYSSTAIGKVLNRDHTTILHALRLTKRSHLRVV